MSGQPAARNGEAARPAASQGVNTPPAATIAADEESAAPFYSCDVWPFTGDVPANANRYRAARALAALELELHALQRAEPGGIGFAMTLRLVQARLERHFLTPYRPLLEEWELA